MRPLLTTGLLCLIAFAAARAQEPAPSGISGVVMDSIHGIPLAGAVVSVVGSPRRATTDSTGRFRIDSLEPGAYELALQHALLDTLGLVVGSRRIILPAGRYVIVALATPSPSTVGRLYCRNTGARVAPGLLVGRLTDADGNTPAPGARVTFAYAEATASAPAGVSWGRRSLQVTTRPDGGFAICGLPRGARGLLRAQRAGVSTGEVEVSLEGGILGMRSLTIGPPASAGAVLLGRVVDTLGTGIFGAQVAVVGTAAAGVTDEAGGFALSGLPSGTQVLAVRRAGFPPLAVAVDLTALRPRTVTVRLRGRIEAR